MLPQDYVSVFYFLVKNMGILSHYADYINVINPVVDMTTCIMGKINSLGHMTTQTTMSPIIVLKQKLEVGRKVRNFKCCMNLVLTMTRKIQQYSSKVVRE